MLEILFSLKTMESLQNKFAIHFRATPLLPLANKVCKGYIFTGVCVSTGGCVCLNACSDTPPWANTPPLQTHPGRHPPGQTHPLPLGSACWDTVNKRAVCILLECNLVFNENSIASIITVLMLTLGVNGS